MSALTSEAELRLLFRETDRDEVELAPELTFPLAVESARTWSVGPRVFLVFRAPADARAGARLRGIVFHRNSGALPDVVAMCEWCHAVRGNGRVKLLSCKTDDRRRLGLYLCSDLACLEPTRDPRGPDDIPDGLDGAERARRALLRAAELAARRLF
jgi:FBP C-terminal treble-clef zinc-finger